MEWHGIDLEAGSGTGNSIRGNSIFANGGLGIDIEPIGVGPGGGANNDKAAQHHLHHPQRIQILQ